MTGLHVKDVKIEWKNAYFHHPGHHPSIEYLG
jgi:hypothetical protein